MRLPAIAMSASKRSCEQEAKCAEAKNNALFFIILRTFENLTTHNYSFLFVLVRFSGTIPRHHPFRALADVRLLARCIGGHAVHGRACRP
ncbi:hypothetical protein [Janthinobacterium sp. RB2P8]|uniref:hypothetical protein n=1 Tax=Janthinobacterium sp. RB2P8 TaxID=3424191 RepID=UPI003F297B88